ncbi:MAG TPA: TIR domain-containing protein, partial [Xanthomonadales bacterium]|nr:TIR domain-containing protein [Xanthomonadales bacterium]
LEQPAPAYRGGDPFVFVSYSHLDEKIVYQEIRWLQDHGVNIWYDTHIQAGSEWSDALADAIAGCARFVYFITPDSVASEHCRRELNLAIEEGRSIVAVHLQETDVPGGIRLNLNNRQAILKHRLPAETYRTSLLQALSIDRAVASEPSAPPRTFLAGRRARLGSALTLVALVAIAAGWLSLRGSQEAASGGAAIDLGASSRAIAVLPFDNATQNRDDVYLNSVSDEIREQLGRVPEIRVAARSSSIAALKRGMDAMATSEALNVAYVIEGSVRRSGDRLRISVQLIDGSSGFAVWSNVYERNSNQLLNVQQAIADEVVNRMLPDADRVVSMPATRNTDANELMLLAKYYEQQVRARQIRDDDTLLEAIGLYRQAAELDPESALAHSRLASALLFLGDIDAAEAPIFKALSINSNLSEVQNTLGEFYWARGMPQAEAAFERAVQINPNNAAALQNYAHHVWLSMATEPDPGDLFRQALALDPLMPARHYALGDYLAKDGQFAEVPGVIRRIEALFKDAESFRAIASLHELLGEVDLAIAWSIRARDAEPNNPDHVANLAELYAIIGEAETALALGPPPNVGVLFHLRRHQELIDEAEMLMIEQPENIGLRYMLALSYVATNRFEEAIRILLSTGQPGTVTGGIVRSVADAEAFMTLINAFAGSGLPEAPETGISLATWLDEFWQERYSFGGEIGWRALFHSCNLTILERHGEALELLPRVNESPRLRRSPLLRDLWCFRQHADHPTYRAVLEEQERRRAALRERLPETLAAYGV